MPAVLNFCKRCQQAFACDNKAIEYCAGCDSLNFKKKEIVNECTVCGATTVDSVPRKICAFCDLSAKKNSAAATPQEKKSSATPNLKLFKITVYRNDTGGGVLVRTSIILDIDEQMALMYEGLRPGERQEVTEITGPFKAGTVIHSDRAGIDKWS